MKDKGTQLGTLEGSLAATPEEAFQSLDTVAEQAGGPWVEPAGYQGSTFRTRLWG